MPTETIPQRPTKEIKTSGGHTIVINQWITGGDARDIRNVFIGEADVSFVGDKPQVSGVKANVQAKAEDRAIQAVVVSVDGMNDDIVNRVLALTATDYDEVIQAVNEVTRPQKKSEANS